MNKLVDTFAHRLSLAMQIRNIKATELHKKTGIAKSSISEYINGKYEAKQDGVYLISEALNVNPAWLMGADVPMERQAIPHKNIDEIPKDLKDFVIAYHRDEDLQKNIKGLSPEEISDAVRFYKEMKNRMNKDNNT